MASPPLESLSIASAWPLEWVRIIKDFTFDLGCVAALGLFVQCLIPRLSLWRRAFLLLPILLIFLFGLRGMPELWSGPIRSWGEALDRHECSKNMQVMVILGGGFAGPGELALSTHSRIKHGARVIERSRGQKDEKLVVIVTGGPTLSRKGPPESQLMKEALLTQLPWLAHSRVLEESTSLNTRDNAVHVGKLLSTANIEGGIALVTSRLHMPRAYQTFKSVGVDVCPLPSQDVEHVSEGALNFRNADRTARVLNEYVGYLGYRSRGWIE